MTAKMSFGGIETRLDTFPIWEHIAGHEDYRLEHLGHVRRGTSGNENSSDAMENFGQGRQLGIHG